MLGTPDLKDSKDRWCNVQPLCLWVTSKYQGVIGIYLTNCLIELRRIMSRPPKKILLPKWWVKWCSIYPFSHICGSGHKRPCTYRESVPRVGEAPKKPRVVLCTWNSPRDFGNFGQNLRPKHPSLTRRWWRDLASLVWGGMGGVWSFLQTSKSSTTVENDTKDISLDGNKRSIDDILKISTAVVRWYSTKFAGFFSFVHKTAKQLCYLFDPSIISPQVFCSLVAFLPRSEAPFLITAVLDG